MFCKKRKEDSTYINPRLFTDDGIVRLLNTISCMGMPIIEENSSKERSIYELMDLTTEKLIFGNTKKPISVGEAFKENIEYYIWKYFRAASIDKHTRFELGSVSVIMNQDDFNKILPTLVRSLHDINTDEEQADNFGLSLSSEYNSPLSAGDSIIFYDHDNKLYNVFISYYKNPIAVYAVPFIHHGLGFIAAAPLTENKKYFEKLHSSLEDDIEHEDEYTVYDNIRHDEDDILIPIVPFKILLPKSSTANKKKTA